MLLPRPVVLHMIFGKDCPKGTPEYACLANLVVRKLVPFVVEDGKKLFREEDMEEIENVMAKTMKVGYISVLELSKQVGVAKSTLDAWFREGLIHGWDQGMGVDMLYLNSVKTRIEELRSQKGNILGKHENVAHQSPCKVCGTMFAVKPSHYAEGQKVTCSTKCSEIYRDEQKVFYVTPSNERIEIDDYLRQVIYGELLGDGCISRIVSENRNSLFSYNTTNLEYSKYLRNILRPLNPGNIIMIPEGYDKREQFKNSSEKYMWVTKTNPVLTEIYREWYPNGKKIIPESLVLTPTILLHWFIGDGCLTGNNSNSQSISLHTQGFEEKDIDLLISKLEGVGLAARRQFNGAAVDGHDKYAIRFRSTHFSRFLKYIGPCPVPSYEYKWALNPTYEKYEKYTLSTGDVAKRLECTPNSIRSFSCSSWFKSATIDHTYMWSKLRFSEEGYAQLEAELRARGTFKESACVPDEEFLSGCP